MNDRERVEALLGRPPRGAFDVVVRHDRTGDPVVVRNAPFLDDGTPMPTRFYLVGADLVRAVSRLEADGGVRRAEAEIPADQIADTHRRYAAERDAGIPADHAGPRPSGGVGGTRIGVKCLHAHVAHVLAGGDDPVGRWALEQLGTVAGPGDAAQADTTEQPGALVVHLLDRSVELDQQGGGRFELPIGPEALLDGPLERADVPRPEQLTNAIGLVHDHLDDMLIQAPSIAAAVSVTAVGTHAMSLARTEIGSHEVPADYRLHRADADEVFRTLVVEPAAERRHNPGLEESHVESIVGTCCVILGIMRRLELRHIDIRPAVDASPAGPGAATRVDASSGSARA